MKHVQRKMKRKKKRKRCTSNSGSSSKMGWVTDASSLCLDCKEKREQEIMLKRKASTHVRISYRKVKST